MTALPFWIPGSREDARPGMTTAWARLDLPILWNEEVFCYRSGSRKGQQYQGFLLCMGLFFAFFVA
jgi:hypothetical protein